MKEFYYVLQHKTVTVKGTNKVLFENTIVLGYNLNEEEQNDKFYCFDKTEKHRKSTIQFDDNDTTILIQNAYGCHSKKYRNDDEAYKYLVTIPNEFNAALAIINKHGFDVVPKRKVVSYQQAVGL